MSWTAQADASWLILSSTTGTTPSTVTVSPDTSVSSFASGTYNGNITVTAPDAKGNPIIVPVTLQVISGGAIEVKTNLDEATFEITGPQNYSSSGTSWIAGDVPSGSYQITFGDVPNYKTPTPRTFTVTAGSTATIEANYEIVRLANTIVAAKGPDPNNDGTIRLFDLNGNMLVEINALTTSYGANVASGDLNGDLSDEIVVASGPSSTNNAIITVLKHDGTVLATRTIPQTTFGANIATGDINRDGVAEIAISMVAKVRNRNTYMVDIYNYSNGSLSKRIGAYASPAKNKTKAPLNIAMADINGDGRSELIVFDDGYLKVYGFNSNLTTYLIASKAVTYTNSKNQKVRINNATLTAGDIDGDGKAEIIIGYVNDRGDSMIKAFRPDLTETGLNITAFSGGNASPSLSAMDMDGDGKAEYLLARVLLQRMMRC